MEVAGVRTSAQRELGFPCYPGLVPVSLTSGPSPVTGTVLSSSHSREGEGQGIPGCSRLPWKGRWGGHVPRLGEAWQSHPPKGKPQSWDPSIHLYVCPSVCPFTHPSNSVPGAFSSPISGSGRVEEVTQAQPQGAHGLLGRIHQAPAVPQAGRGR